MEKQITQYSVKGASFELKDLDASSRKVAFYLNTFDVLDADFDIIRKGAFNKSILERGPESVSNRKIAFLRFHDWEKPIGKFIELSEDNKGLFGVAFLGNSTAGSDALNDYQDGIIREHSIGFKYLKDKIRFIEDGSTEIGGFYDVSEVMLYEGSAVTFGANEFTNVVDVAKSEGRQKTAQKYSAEIDNITKAIISGQGSDERIHGLEMRLKFLNANLVALASAEPFIKHPEDSKPQEVKAFNWLEVTNNLHTI
jgi:hypothetical protein